MQILAITFFFGVLAVHSVAMALLLESNTTRLRSANKMDSLYGKSSCPCVGIDNLKGYYATQQDFVHVQYAAEAGASCGAWDDGQHPQCRGGTEPWCKKEWCYVDPCNCDLEVPPKPTTVGITYRGSPAYWSYKTCGNLDLWSEEMNPGACHLQKSEGDCGQNPKCAWHGGQCGGKEAILGCKDIAAKDPSIYGEEDCRCVGLGGRDVGSAFMYVSDGELARYPTNVGATCEAWENDAHPDCKKDGPKPGFCSARWCFVDPCKCKTKVPPRSVMKANSALRFQGKTAYWSYSTCGSTDTWSPARAGEYCVTQTTEAACSKISKCAWNGKECLGKALVDICKKQEESGIIGIEAPLSSGAVGRSTLIALLAAAGAIATTRAQ